ncbi:hypothetical protein Tco_0765059, partial [Tanacetum coccineum]
SVPCKSKAASVPAGSKNSPASVTAGGSDPAASRNRPAVNSAGRPNPAGWSKRLAPVSAGWLNPAARPYFRPSSVLKIHTNDNVADLLTKAFDGPRFEYLVVHIGMVVHTAARCTFFLLTGLVSAGRTMILLVVILSAERLVSAGRTMILLVVILSAERLVSAGRTMILLVVILSAGRLVSAGRTMILLVVILPAGCFVSDGSYGLCCWFRVHAGGHTSAGGFISAAGCVFLLSAWLLLLDDSFCWLNTFMLLNCCAQFDIAGWLVSATSHLVSAAEWGAERKQWDLIEAAKYMIWTDSKFPTMFWTEAVSNGFAYRASYNFGLSVHDSINTSDHLGKFEGKADEGYLVGYAPNSKAYRVYNLTTTEGVEGRKTMNLRDL